MIGRASSKSSLLTIWLASVLACSILTGCGQGSRNFLAGWARTSEQIGHTVAFFAPVGNGHSVASLAPSAESRPAPAARTDLKPDLIRDPFLEPSPNRVISQSERRADRRPEDSPSGVDSPRRAVSAAAVHYASAPAAAADHLAYLDRELIRLAAAMQESEPPRVHRQPEWATPEQPLGQQIPGPPSPQPARLAARFDELAARESQASPNGFSHAVQSRAGASFAPTAVPEDLRSPPQPHDSHLSLIVDSHLVPPRSQNWTSQDGQAPIVADASVGPIGRSFAPGMPAEPSSTPALFSTTRSERAAVPQTPSSPQNDSRPMAPPAPATVGGELGEGAAVLPAIDLVMNVDAPGPAAPDVGSAGFPGTARSGTWHGRPHETRPGDQFAADSAPRTLKPIEFGGRPSPDANQSFPEIPGPLAIGLGVLLVALIGGALRRRFAGRGA